MFKRLFTFRGGPLDKDDEQLSHEAPVVIFNIKVLPVLSESIPYSLCLGFGTFTHAQTPTWSTGVVELPAPTGCQLTCSACLITTNVIGQVVELCLLVCRPFGSNGLDLSVKQLKFF